ncbi:hypothetical protein [Desulfosporosinus youngiae]|uniref:hypothetical protein n=1 Tax=Desulfosporosinus youngiae TaxID=339862 RepID=UPI0002D4FCAC|nr:hypothetical protein [Desulfosporosinus youngiae]
MILKPQKRGQIIPVLRPLSIVIGEQGMQFTRPVASARRADCGEMFIKKEE